MSGKAIGFLLLLWWSPAAGDLFPALADSFPDRPIELVIGNQPGGAMDFIAGAFKEKVAAILGQPVLSVFKAGAGTSLAAAYVARARADGNTLLFGSAANLVLIPLTKKDLGYTLDDFAPVCNLTSAPNLMCVRDDAPYRTLADFIQAAKTKRMKYATYGVNSGPHILMEGLGKAAGEEYQIYRKLVDDLGMGPK
jgi:tripartite-type tricarboxylate transporter receptor subunit TctC